MKLSYAPLLLASMALAGTAWAQTDLSASEFEASPSFVETFAGGSTVGEWELDPDWTGSTVFEAQYITSTPSGIDSAVVALDPVSSSSDGGVMMSGNDSADAGTHFGLNYMRCINSLANGTGDDFTSIDKYRVVASVYLYSTTEISSRWQGGPYGNGGDLFRASAWYNTGSTGGGPGFGSRGDGTNTISGTSPLDSPGWTKMSLMIDSSDADSANWRMAITVDANGDGTLDESDPLEYLAHSLDSSRVPGPFGIFTVGDVARDTFPMFVDTVEYYAPASAVNDWSIY